MLNDKLQPFYTAVHRAMMEVGKSAPRVADRVLEEAFPETARAAKQEGADNMLRNGMIDFLSKYMKRNSNLPDEAQTDMYEIADDFRPIVNRMQSRSHYVPSLEQHMPVAFLILNPEYLDEARRFKRQKGNETIAEAVVLDELYEAVTGGAA